MASGIRRVRPRRGRGDHSAAPRGDSATTKKMVKAVKKKNCSNLDEWADNHPGSREGKDPHGPEYIDLVTEATGGDVIDGHEIKTNMNKIVKGIAKSVKLNVDNSGNMVEE